MNIQDNFSPESNALNYDYDLYKPLTPKLSQTKPSECEQYKTLPHDDTRSLKAKLETKKLRLREMRTQFENVCEENASLKFRLAELERGKSSQTSQEKRFFEKEKELVAILQRLEDEVKFY